MADRDEARTYRVRQLPCGLTFRKQVALLLARIIADVEAENVQVFSLAPSLNSREIPSSKVATVMFSQTPSAFNKSQSKDNEWVIPGRSAGLGEDVIVDVHFQGFTPLNDVLEDDHTLDCIAISGLASHPFGSWKQRGQHANFMWLRDRLPREAPNVRSIIYGYDTSLLESESVKTIHDIAASLLERMQSLGMSSPSSKPTLIIAHSLGGIILKQAVVSMALPIGSTTPMVDAIRAVICFGVPNRGMKVSHLLPMVEGRPNSQLVQLLSADSDYLQSLDEQFSGVALHSRIKIFSVYETTRSPTTKKHASGQWRRDGPLELLVDKLSAIQQSSEKNMPIDEDHSNMVKFKADDQDCQAIVNFISSVATSSGMRARGGNSVSSKSAPHPNRNAGKSEEPTAHALQQPVSQCGMQEPAQRCQNADVASPDFDSNRIRSSASTSYDRNPFPAGSIHPNDRSVPKLKFSISRKPVNKSGKKILIAVFGMTGTGKTSFIKTLAGEAASSLRTGHDLKSCTQEIETIDFTLDGHHVTLVDTPGFDDSDRSDTEILKLIADWLGSSYKSQALLSGIIYLHRISDVRMSGSSVKNLRMFRKLCGAENMSKVCLLTTMWDKVTPQDGSAKEKELQGPGFWGPIIARGSIIKRHDRGIDSAREVVRSMLVNKPTTIKLQEEIFVSGKELIETDAGSFINEEILKLQEQYKQHLEELREEMGSAMLQSNQQLQGELQAEYTQIVSQLEQQAEHREKLAQAKFERRWQDKLDEMKRRERELRASVSRERDSLAEQASAEKEREKERLERASSTRELEPRMPIRTVRENFEHDARQRERFEPGRERGGYEEHSRRREAGGDRSPPNTVRARSNNVPVPYLGPTWSETKMKREKHNGQPYKTFQCYVPKTFRSSGCGRPFDVVHPMAGKVQCCYCGKNWTIWGRGRLR